MDPTTDTQPQYSIGVTARRTGLSTHVLRAWERRYAVVSPDRSEGGVRLYSGEDILRLRLLRRVTEAGHPIGQVASLTTNELLALVRDDHDSGDAGTVPDAQRGARFEEHVGPILEAVEAMDSARIHATLLRSCVTLGVWDFMEGVAIPTLKRVGELWLDDALCPAQEHLFSVQLRRVLSWVLESLPVSDESRGVVATTPSGQLHELGAMLAGVVVAVEGWRVTYVGPDLPAVDIATAAEVTRSRLVLLSVVWTPDRPGLVEGVQTLRGALRPDIGIIVGGAAGAAYADDLERAGATYLPDLRALRALLREIGSAEAIRGARLAPGGARR